jgi:PAS domain S-box-containing protein
VRDESEAVAGMFCAVAETTDRVLTQRREAEAKQRQQRMFEQAPGFICTLAGPDHVFEFVNAAYARLFGERDFVGRSVREVFPELQDQGYFEALDAVYATGERFVASQMPARLEYADGRVEDRQLDFVYAPISDASGRISGIFCEGFDVTERRRAEEHQRLMVNELNHRVKNTLATVQSIAIQTLRGAGIPAAVREALTSRLLALASAHDVLTDEKWRGADIRELLEQTAAPYAALDDHKPLVLEGPRVYLAPKTSIALALAFHELATNAAKYGALSTAGGQVRVAWSVTDSEAGRRLELVWRESGGPPVTPPTRTGFGTRLIQRGLSIELGGEVTLDYRREGLVCTVRTRLDGDGAEEGWSAASGAD